MHGSSFALSVAWVKVVRHTPQLSSCGKLWKNERELSGQERVCQHYCLPGSLLRKSPLLPQGTRQKWGTLKHTYLDEDYACGFPSK